MNIAAQSASLLIINQLPLSSLQGKARCGCEISSWCAFNSISGPLKAVTLRVLHEPEAIDKLLGCDGYEVLFARRPWSTSAEAMIISLEPEDPAPPEIEGAGFDYFLEAVIAKEIVEALGANATEDRQRSLLI